MSDEPIEYAFDETADRQRRLDEFARAAMQSLLLAAGQIGQECLNNADRCAFWAYEQAEAMLAESARRAAPAQKEGERG